MITNTDAEKKFTSNNVIEAEPTGIRRVIIPAYGFAGATPQKRQDSTFSVVVYELLCVSLPYGTVFVAV